MSKHKNKCESHDFHRYKRYLTTKHKPIWRCVDCPSGFNYMPMMIGSKARCYTCGEVYPLISMDLENGDTPLEGKPIVCGTANCDELGADKKRKALAERFAERISGKLKEQILAGSDIASRSESEQESVIAALIQEDQS